MVDATGERLQGVLAGLRAGAAESWDLGRLTAVNEAAEVVQAIRGQATQFGASMERGRIEAAAAGVADLRGRLDAAGLAEAGGGADRVSTLLATWGEAVQRLAALSQRWNRHLQTSRGFRDEANAALTDLLASARQAATAQEAAFSAAVARSNGIFLAVSAAIVVAGLLISLRLAGSVAGPLQRLSGVMAAIGGGARAVPVPDTARQDEIGGMARAVAVFQDGLAEAERLAAAQRAQSEAGEARTRLVADLTRDFEGAMARLTLELTGAASGMEAAARVAGRDRGGSRRPDRRRRRGGEPHLGQRAVGGRGDGGTLGQHRRDRAAGHPVLGDRRPGRGRGRPHRGDRAGA